MSEHFQKVAYIGLRNDDGSFLLNVPLYIRISDLNKSGVTAQQEELIHKISQIMIAHYDRQIAKHISQTKNSKESTL